MSEERLSHLPGSYLELPGKSVELEDPGAQDSAISNSDEEHFSDASEGHHNSNVCAFSPVQRTPVEKIDGSLSHGEVLRTHAYGERAQDAVSDEIDVAPEDCHSETHSDIGLQLQNRSRAPGKSSISQTVEERIDPSAPSNGDIIGKTTYEQREMSAAPSLVLKVSGFDLRPQPLSLGLHESGFDNSNTPETRSVNLDSQLDEAKSGLLYTNQGSPSDVLPDSVGSISALRESPTSSQANPRVRSCNGRKPTFNSHDDITAAAAPVTASVAIGPMVHSGGLAGGQDVGEDDFGDFDDGFEEPMEVATEEVMDQNDMQPQRTPTLPPIPLIDLGSSKSVPDLIASLDPYLDVLFPASKGVSSLPPVEPIPNSSAIFSTDRSLSLWSQLVAPPPLQPQNWVKSRIRRLFLVSLGVPVDLDEILPASKQKKLILPSINADGTTAIPSAPHVQSQTGMDGSHYRTTSATTAAHRPQSRRGEPPPPPELDLTAVNRLCLTTDAALDGLTDAELQDHICELERTTQRASTVLEYWLKRRDGLVGEKEAFEGVIENLVNHARRVRK